MAENHEHTSCLICDNKDLALMPGYEKAFLCRCRKCGFVFSKKIPTQEELVEHYQGYSRNDYLSPITIKRYNELLDSFEKYRKSGKILDVGCGIGYFLEQAKLRGWEVYGTEYTDEAVNICVSKGISMKQGKLNPDNYTSESFDIITSFEVIEHINNPIEEIQNFYKLLRPGGLVYITTPNFNSLLRYRLKGNYNVIVYPEHLSYYTPSTLKTLFRKQGFISHKIVATGISITRLRTSKGESDQAFISESSDDEQLRQRFERNTFFNFIKYSLNTLLTMSGKGDSLKGYFIKR